MEHEIKEVENDDDNTQLPKLLILESPSKPYNLDQDSHPRQELISLKRILTPEKNVKIIGKLGISSNNPSPVIQTDVNIKKTAAGNAVI
jgi:hypothetical protein